MDQPYPDPADTSDNQLTYNINLQLTDVYKPKLKQRKNIDNLTDDELYRLRCVFFELKKLNEWPRDRRSLYSWGKLHGNVCEHGWEQFLTWHRMFLYDFEQTLQDFDPAVTIPYWDWTSPEYNKGKIPTEKGKAPTKEEETCAEKGKNPTKKKEKTLMNILIIIPNQQLVRLSLQLIGVGLMMRRLKI